MDLDRLLFVVLLIFFSMIGISGNILTLIVYNKKNNNLSKKTFINILALLDLFVCLTVIPYSIFLELRLVKNLFMCHFMEFVRYFSVIASNITLVCIAGERYIAVSRPMGIPSTRVKNTIMALLLLLVCVPVAIPSGFTFTINKKDLCGNRTLTNETETECIQEICEYTTSILTPHGVNIYKIIQVIIYITGITLMIAFYALVFKTLYLRDKRKRCRVHPLGSMKSDKRNFEYPVVSNITREREIKHMNACLNCFGGSKIGISDQKTTEEPEGMPIKHGNKIAATECIQTLRINVQTGKLPCKGHAEPSTSKSVPEEETAHVSNEMKSEQIVHHGRLTGTKMNHDIFCIHGKPREFLTKNNTDLKQKSVFDIEDSVTDNWMRHTEKLSKMFVSGTIKTSNSVPQSRKLIQRKTSTMLFICTVIFLFSWVPFWIDVFGVTNSLFVRYLFFTGHATNPIVYGIVNDEVRKRLLALFPCGKLY